jgi:hypothetical protein
VETTSTRWPERRGQPQKLHAADDADHDTGQCLVVVAMPCETRANRICIRPVAPGQSFIDDEYRFGRLGILAPWKPARTSGIPMASK